ncbi:hypothetical protein DRQ32_03290 [bacterium]|nr:MAG: hypothetical protein DRQ32_03290 [bacterium]
MSDQRNGGISWTNETWNPIRGCSRVSAGCENCYAEVIARRFCGPGQPYEGLVQVGRDGEPKAKWNGTVRMVELCRETKTPVFVKQLGGHVVCDGITVPGGHWPGGGKARDDRYPQAGFRVWLKHKKGADMDEWPEDLRVQELPNGRMT